MIYEGFHQGDGVCAIGTLSYGMLLSQSVATSIDAFAIGLLLCPPIHHYLMCWQLDYHFCAGESGDLFGQR